MSSRLKTFPRASTDMIWTVLIPVMPSTGPLRVWTIQRWLIND